MSNEDNPPDENNERDGDDVELNDISTVLEMVKRVLVIAVLVARLIEM